MISRLQRGLKPQPKSSGLFLYCLCFAVFFLPGGCSSERRRFPYGEDPSVLLPCACACPWGDFLLRKKVSLWGVVLSVDFYSHVCPTALYSSLPLLYIVYACECLVMALGVGEGCPPEAMSPNGGMCGTLFPKDPAPIPVKGQIPNLKNFRKSGNSYPAFCIMFPVGQGFVTAVECFGVEGLLVGGFCRNAEEIPKGGWQTQEFEVWW